MVNLSRLSAYHAEGAREGADVAPARRALPQRTRCLGRTGLCRKCLLLSACP